MWLFNACLYICLDKSYIHIFESYSLICHLKTVKYIKHFPCFKDKWPSYKEILQYFYYWNCFVQSSTYPDRNQSKRILVKSEIKIISREHAVKHSF